MPRFFPKQAMIERLLQLTRYITEAHFDFFPDFKPTHNLKNGFRMNSNLSKNFWRMSEVLSSDIMTTVVPPLRYKRLYRFKRDRCDFTGKDRWEHDFGMFQIAVSLVYWFEIKMGRNVQITYNEKLGDEKVRPDVSVLIDDKYKFHFEYERSRTAIEILNNKIPQYEKIKLDNARVVFVIADETTSGYTLNERKDGADKEKVLKILPEIKKPKNKYLFIPYSRIPFIDKPEFYLPDGNKTKLIKGI